MDVVLGARKLLWASTFVDVTWTQFLVITHTMVVVMMAKLLQEGLICKAVKMQDQTVELHNMVVARMVSQGLKAEIKKDVLVLLLTVQGLDLGVVQIEFQLLMVGILKAVMIALSRSMDVVLII